MAGFVYIWRDHKHNRFYIGSHWGHESDGYICSSRWMRNAYKRRLQDFKRRIISRINTCRQDLLTEEHRWLQLIPLKQLGKKYYNLTRHLNGHWSTDDQKSLTIKQKLSIAQKRNFEDPEYLARFMETRKNLPPQTKETRERRKLAMRGKNVGRAKTPAYYEARTRLKLEGKMGNSEEHRQRTKELGVFKSLNNTRVTCIHCGTQGNPGNIARYHNDRCKLRTS